MVNAENSFHRATGLLEYGNDLFGIGSLSDVSHRHNLSEAGEHHIIGIQKALRLGHGGLVNGHGLWKLSRSMVGASHDEFREAGTPIVFAKMSFRQRRKSL